MNPNFITSLRLVFGALMIVSAYKQSLLLFIGFYFLAIITDILDGFAARKLNRVTNFGKKFDALADNFIVICVLISYILLKPTLIKTYQYVIFFLFAYFVLLQLLSYLIKGKLFFMRNYAALLAAIIFPFVVIISFFFESTILISLYIIITVYSLTEKFFLHMTRKKRSVFLLKSFKTKIIFILIVMAVCFLVFMIPKSNNQVCFEDGYCVNVEVKRTPEERSVGLMFRENLAETQGMLFVFDVPERYTFWMKNVKFPIDIIFIDYNYNIVYIAEKAQPCYEEPCELYTSNAKALYVVETVSGFSEKHYVVIGQKVNFSLDNGS